MSKQGIGLLADHLCIDHSSVKDYEYQKGQFTQKIFVVDDKYYCPYKTKPSNRNGNFGTFDKNSWVKVDDICFPNEDSVIWVYEDEANLEVSPLINADKERIAKLEEALTDVIALSKKIIMPALSLAVMDYPSSSLAVMSLNDWDAQMDVIKELVKENN